ncbi:MAG TPA: hypothetical protein VJY62_07780 [Bacteroidia bacterium]|nr:hypothetical protein [Bacteroidia bacterium]
MANSSKRPIALLALSRFRKIGNFILMVRTVILNITNHTGFFATPAPPLATVITDTNDLEAAEAIAKTHVTGSAAARDLQYDIVLNDMYGLQGYVQNLADLAADEATAIAIINASGFGLRNHGVRVKPLLSVKHGDEEGAVKLFSKAAGKRASYEWGQSPDGIAWTDLPVTLQAKTTVTGLTVGSKMYYRVRPVLKDGAGFWSPVVSIIVM